MPVDIERTSFIGWTIPQEVKTCMKHLNKAPEAMIEDLINIVKLHMLCDDAVESEFQKCLAQHGETALEIYPGLLKIVQLGTRQPQYSLHEKHFLKDLNDINVPKKYQEKLKELVFGTDRQSMDQACNESKIRYPTLDSFKWRVDVAISSGKLKRVLEPAILMEMRTNDGKNHSFEVSKQEFHELRYSVANVLKQMQQLEKRSVLQIKS